MRWTFALVLPRSVAPHHVFAAASFAALLVVRDSRTDDECST
jgi:hypothetical protein